MRKKNSEDSSHLPENSSVSLEEALNHLQQSLARLETLSHSFILSLKNSDQELLQKYCNLYDLSRSEKKNVRELAVTLSIDGQALDHIKQLLELSSVPLHISPLSVVQDAVHRIVSKLSKKGSQLDTYHLCFVSVLNTVSELSGPLFYGEVSSDDLLVWLRPFCGNVSLPVKPRIEVLQILEQAFNLSDEDSKLLVFYRTQAVLKTSWPQRQILKSAESILQFQLKHQALLLEHFYVDCVGFHHNEFRSLQCCV
ncbi:Neuroblastoma-amplified sequence [Acipenser ruthenus]|uniref:Neuroblastoma-amplified sequence n=1 Tax=Acipenser ruthenus TaxID=7906 RepID=A0A444UPB0_ACIRT|nr:Neuroblastoma-amplified sequence [Acipenser ruthenus]